jgi:hypothetical protein
MASIARESFTPARFVRAASAAAPDPHLVCVTQ